ncbi:hypothetical protein BEL04_21740 [Mucilaginibacter sp. PPCGB 2223]|uniref:DUF6515 family protein n=1 Tax=Mucilaginibacter sp. PPCGB 2223 TaxID=1886027 RepID=UPI00082451EC|nr:DUF6515 family protein [Mucilaginibacter sp. PPCGB 2223]OCX50408.1 hypothetical protein BEL04_21740 [Mucilaginibacter sp. PPCGB 2223]
MKSIIKNLTTLGIGAFSLLIVTAASAQRVRVGIGFGFGYPHYYYNPYGRYYGYAYPRIGLSFGYLPYGYIPFYFGTDLYYLNNGVYYRQYDDHYYHVVAPPIGAEVPKLPGHARSLMIDNQQYFELNGVYYKPNIKADGTTDYIITGKDGVLNTRVVPVPPAPQGNVTPPPPPAPPANDQLAPPADQNAPAANDQLPPPPSDEPAPKVGDIVSALPNGCKAVTVAGKKYFVSASDVYYEEFNNKGKVNYKVAGVPETQNQ